MGQHYLVRAGGLMRCCTASLDDAMSAATEPPKDGDTLRCKFGGGDHGYMIFRDGAWEWDMARGQNDG